MIWGSRSLKYKIGFNCDKEAVSEAHLEREYQLGFKHVLFDNVEWDASPALYIT